MPLKKGRSKAVLAANIAECMKSYKEKGTIGNVTPKNAKHAMKICVAIAYQAAKKSGGKG